MPDDQTGSLLGRQLFQRQDSLQHLAHVGHRQGGQGFKLHLLCQVRVARVKLDPFVFGLSHEPGGQDIHGQMMLPRLVLPSLQFIPASFRFRVLVGSFHKVREPEDAIGICHSFRRRYSQCLMRRI